MSKYIVQHTFISYVKSPRVSPSLFQQSEVPGVPTTRVCCEPHKNMLACSTLILILTNACPLRDTVRVCTTEPYSMNLAKCHDTVSNMCGNYRNQMGTRLPTQSIKLFAAAQFASVCSPHSEFPR